MGHLEIRDVVPADAPVMAAVRTASKRFGYREFMPAAYLDAPERAVEVIEEIRADFAAGRPGGRGHLALLDGAPVGMTWIGHTWHEYAAIPEGHAYLASLFVAPSAIGTGVGRTLFWHALGALASDGFARASLLTYAPNVRARRFYEAMGWRHDGYSIRHTVDWPPGPFDLESVRYVGPTQPGGV